MTASDPAYEEIMVTAASVAAYLEEHPSSEAAELRCRLDKCRGLLDALRVSRTAIASANAHMAELYVELEEAKEAADAANAAKATFLATMSHELRTPMNGILGMLEVFAGTSLTARQQEMLGVVRRSGAALLDLLNAVLDYSKIDAGKLELEATDFDLGLVVEDVVALMGATASANGVAVTAAIAPGSETLLRGDPARIRQVLSNLLGNAVKFTKEGAVTVTVRVLAGEEGRRTVAIDVADTGIGIAPEVLPRLFQAFTQADSSTTRRYGGTGLGLAIAAQLAALMGGRITVESELGRGSVFHVELALERARAAVAFTPPPVARPALARPSRSRRVLLAEDHEVNRMVGVAMLEQLGCAVTLAADGREAVTALEAHEFDLVFMDCRMPVMDGWEAAREIRARESAAGRKRTRIVALTANAFEQDREACLAAGMDDFLTKPITQAGLDAALARWCTEPLPPKIELLDAGIVEGLLALRRPGRPDIFGRALQSWTKTSEGDIAKLRATLAAGDLEGARRVAHSLRGAIASIGGKHVAGIFAEVERHASAGDGDAAMRLITGLDDACAATLDALRAVA